MGEASEQTVAEGAKAIIDRAVKNQISDIHIEPLPKLVTVRYRHAGQLYVASKLPKSSGELLARHFKKMARLEEKISNAPQAGSFQIKSGRKLYNLEIATMPVLDGEKITLHVNLLAQKLPGLAELGFWGEGLAAVNHAIARMQGLVLIADRQGGGIGLSLSAILQAAEAARAKTAYIGSDIMLPAGVEKFSRGSAAVPDDRRLKILDKQGFETFGIELFSDKKSAQTAIELAASKKFVLTGVVAPGAAAGINSLKNVQENHLLAANLNLAIGQTFVRRLCERCREAYQPSPLEQKQLNELFQTGRASVMKQINRLERLAANSSAELSTSEKSVQRLWRARTQGCKACDYTGHSGAIGVFEVCEPGDELRSQIAAGRSATTLQKAALQSGMISLRVDGLIKSLLGFIDMPTLLSVCV